MKRIKFLFVFLLTLSLTACTGCVENTNVKSGNRRSQDRSLINMTDEQVETVDRLMGYFISKDNESLKSMFCEIIRTTGSIDEQIQSAFEFFDSEIVSYSGIQGGAINKATERGKIIRLAFSPTIRNIETNLGTSYEVKVYSYVVYDKYPNRIGISQITIVDENEKECVIGDFYLVNPEKR